MGVVGISGWKLSAFACECFDEMLMKMISGATSVGSGTVENLKL